MLVERSLADTFAVFEDPYNLAKITPPWLSFKVTSRDRVQMRLGAEITYTIRWMGVPLHWKTAIRAYECPFFFIDEQAEGPYRLWRHTHTFHPTPDGTRVEDHVEYALPFGRLGRLVHELVVKEQLEAIFRYRQQALSVLFGGRTLEFAEPVVT